MVINFKYIFKAKIVILILLLLNNYTYQKNFILDKTNPIVFSTMVTNPNYTNEFKSSLFNTDIINKDNNDNQFKLTPFSCKINFKFDEESNGLHHNQIIGVKFNNKVYYDANITYAKLKKHNNNKTIEYNLKLIYNSNQDNKQTNKYCILFMFEYNNYYDFEDNKENNNIFIKNGNFSLEISYINIKINYEEGYFNNILNATIFTSYNEDYLTSLIDYSHINLSTIINNNYISSNINNNSKIALNIDIIDNNKNKIDDENIFINSIFNLKFGLINNLNKDLISLLDLNNITIAIEFADKDNLYYNILSENNQIEFYLNNKILEITNTKNNSLNTNENTYSIYPNAILFYNINSILYIEDNLDIYVNNIILKNKTGILSFSFSLYYKNTHTLIARKDKLIKILPYNISVDYFGHINNWNLFSGGAYPLTLKFNIPDYIVNTEQNSNSGVYFVFKQDNQIKNLNDVYFVASTCQFKEYDIKSNKMRIFNSQCYPLSNYYNFKKTEVIDDKEELLSNIFNSNKESIKNDRKPINDSGIVFKINNISYNKIYYITIWTYIDACDGYYYNNNLNNIKGINFTIKGYNIINLDYSNINNKLNSIYFSNIFDYKNVVAENIKDITLNNCERSVPVIGNKTIKEYIDNNNNITTEYINDNLIIYKEITNFSIYDEINKDNTININNLSKSNLNVNIKFYISNTNPLQDTVSSLNDYMGYSYINKQLNEDKLISIKLDADSSLLTNNNKSSCSFKYSVIDTTSYNNLKVDNTNYIQSNNNIDKNNFAYLNNIDYNLINNPKSTKYDYNEKTINFLNNIYTNCFVLNTSDIYLDNTNSIPNLLYSLYTAFDFRIIVEAKDKLENTKKIVYRFVKLYPEYNVFFNKYSPNNNDTLKKIDYKLYFSTSLNFEDLSICLLELNYSSTSLTNQTDNSLFVFIKNILLFESDITDLNYNYPISISNNNNDNNNISNIIESKGYNSQLNLSSSNNLSIQYQNEFDLNYDNASVYNNNVNNINYHTVLGSLYYVVFNNIDASSSNKINTTNIIIPMYCPIQSKNISNSNNNIKELNESSNEVVLSKAEFVIWTGYKTYDSNNIKQYKLNKINTQNKIVFKYKNIISNKGDNIIRFNNLLNIKDTNLANYSYKDFLENNLKQYENAYIFKLKDNNNFDLENEDNNNNENSNSNMNFKSLCSSSILLLNSKSYPYNSSEINKTIIKNKTSFILNNTVFKNYYMPTYFKNNNYNQKLYVKGREYSYMLISVHDSNISVESYIDNSIPYQYDNSLFKFNHLHSSKKRIFKNTSNMYYSNLLKPDLHNYLDEAVCFYCISKSNINQMYLDYDNVTSNSVYSINTNYIHNNFGFDNINSFVVEFYNHETDFIVFENINTIYYNDLSYKLETVINFPIIIPNYSKIIINSNNIYEESKCYLFINKNTSIYQSSYNILLNDDWNLSSKCFYDNYIKEVICNLNMSKELINKNYLLTNRIKINCYKLNFDIDSNNKNDNLDNKTKFRFNYISIYNNVNSIINSSVYNLPFIYLNEHLSNFSVNKDKNIDFTNIDNAYTIEFKHSDSLNGFGIAYITLEFPKDPIPGSTYMIEFDFKDIIIDKLDNLPFCFLSEDTNFKLTEDDKLYLEGCKFEFRNNRKDRIYFKYRNFIVFNDVNMDISIISKKHFLISKSNDLNLSKKLKIKLSPVILITNTYREKYFNSNKILIDDISNYSKINKNKGRLSFLINNISAIYNYYFVFDYINSINLLEVDNSNLFNMRSNSIIREFNHFGIYYNIYPITINCLEKNSYYNFNSNKYNDIFTKDKQFYNINKLDEKQAMCLFQLKNLKPFYYHIKDNNVFTFYISLFEYYEFYYLIKPDMMINEVSLFLPYAVFSQINNSYIKCNNFESNENYACYKSEHDDFILNISLTDFIDKTEYPYDIKKKIIIDIHGLDYSLDFNNKQYSKLNELIYIPFTINTNDSNMNIRYNIFKGISVFSLVYIDNNFIIQSYNNIIKNSLTLNNTLLNENSNSEYAISYSDIIKNHENYFNHKDYRYKSLIYTDIKIAGLTNSNLLNKKYDIYYFLENTSPSEFTNYYFRVSLDYITNNTDINKFNIIKQPIFTVYFPREYILNSNQNKFVVKAYIEEHFISTNINLNKANKIKTNKSEENSIKKLIVKKIPFEINTYSSTVDILMMQEIRLNLNFSNNNNNNQTEDNFKDISNKINKYFKYVQDINYIEEDANGIILKELSNKEDIEYMLANLNINILNNFKFLYFNIVLKDVLNPSNLDKNNFQYSNYNILLYDEYSLDYYYTFSNISSISTNLNSKNQSIYSSYLLNIVKGLNINYNKSSHKNKIFIDINSQSFDNNSKTFISQSGRYSIFEFKLNTTEFIEESEKLNLYKTSPVNLSLNHNYYKTNKDNHQLSYMYNKKEIFLLGPSCNTPVGIYVLRFDCNNTNEYYLPLSIKLTNTLEKGIIFVKNYLSEETNVFNVYKGSSFIINLGLNSLSVNRINIQFTKTSNLNNSQSLIDSFKFERGDIEFNNYYNLYYTMYYNNQLDLKSNYIFSEINTSAFNYSFNQVDDIEYKINASSKCYAPLYNKIHIKIVDDNSIYRSNYSNYIDKQVVNNNEQPNNSINNSSKYININLKNLKDNEIEHNLKHNYIILNKFDDNNLNKINLKYIVYKEYDIKQVDNYKTITCMLTCENNVHLINMLNLSLIKNKKFIIIENINFYKMLMSPVLDEDYSLEYNITNFNMSLYLNPYEAITKNVSEITNFKIFDDMLDFKKSTNYESLIYNSSCHIAVKTIQYNPLTSSNVSIEFDNLFRSTNYILKCIDSTMESVNKSKTVNTIVFKVEDNVKHIKDYSIHLNYILRNNIKITNIYNDKLYVIKTPSCNYSICIDFEFKEAIDISNAYNIVKDCQISMEYDKFKGCIVCESRDILDNKEINERINNESIYKNLDSCSEYNDFILNYKQISNNMSQSNSTKANKSQSISVFTVCIFSQNNCSTNLPNYKDKFNNWIENLTSKDTTLINNSVLSIKRYNITTDEIKPTSSDIILESFNYDLANMVFNAYLNSKNNNNLKCYYNIDYVSDSNTTITNNNKQIFDCINKKNKLKDEINKSNIYYKVKTMIKNGSSYSYSINEEQLDNAFNKYTDLIEELKNNCGILEFNKSNNYKNAITINDRFNPGTYSIKIICYNDVYYSINSSELFELPNITIN